MIKNKHDINSHTNHFKYKNPKARKLNINLIQNTATTLKNYKPFNLFKKSYNMMFWQLANNIAQYFQVKLSNHICKYHT